MHDTTDLIRVPMAAFLALAWAACSEGPVNPAAGEGSGALTPAQAEDCQVVDDSTEEVLSGVILTFDSSFLCADAPDEGEYTFTVVVANSGGSAEAVTIERASLTHATPRPRGQSPDTSLDAVTGLPLTLEPGEEGSFTLEGEYSLVETDEGKKANLHFQARGSGDESGDPFSFGFNAHLRAPGVAAE